MLASRNRCKSDFAYERDLLTVLGEPLRQVLTAWMNGCYKQTERNSAIPGRSTLHLSLLRLPSCC